MLTNEKMEQYKKLAIKYKDHWWYSFSPQFVLDAIEEIQRWRSRYKWKSIGNAPKDRLILLAAQWPSYEFPKGGSNDWRVKVGGWREDSGTWQIFGASWTPTYWMELPEGPSDE